MIYYTGFNEIREIIEIEYGPAGCMFMEELVLLSRADRRGGYRVMMSSEIPPDIRYESLVSGEHEVDTDDEHLPFTKL